MNLALATIDTVLVGNKSFAFVQGGCLEVLSGMQAGSVDLILGSPPYEDARTYAELNYTLRDQDWVDFMVAFFQAAIPISKGLVIMVVGHGKTRDYQWSATPALLLADLHRAGVHLRCPMIFHRCGIFGSGQSDYFRYDYEFMVVAQNGPGKLPWANNVACGYPPKFAPGGEASYRMTDGQRRTQWGGSLTNGAGVRRRNGDRQEGGRPSHNITSKRMMRDKDGKREQTYKPPVLANPGNVWKYNVGGGHLGHDLAHENEAPYPLDLAADLVLSFVPPGGVVLDPFSGSGTTVHAAVENKRRGVGIDLRQSQVDLGYRRMTSVQPKLMVMADEEYLERKAQGPEAPDDDHNQGSQTEGLFDCLDRDQLRGE